MRKIGWCGWHQQKEHLLCWHPVWGFKAVHSGLWGVYRANTAVGASPEILLLLLLQWPAAAMHQPIIECGLPTSGQPKQASAPHSTPHSTLGAVVSSLHSLQNHTVPATATHLE
jgi:hypothetical protein